MRTVHGEPVGFPSRERAHQLEELRAVGQTDSNVQVLPRVGHDDLAWLNIVDVLAEPSAVVEVDHVWIDQANEVDHIPLGEVPDRADVVGGNSNIWGHLVAEKFRDPDLPLFSQTYLGSVAFAATLVLKRSDTNKNQTNGGPRYDLLRSPSSTTDQGHEAGAAEHRERWEESVLVTIPVVPKTAGKENEVHDDEGHPE